MFFYQIFKKKEILLNNSNDIYYFKNIFSPNMSKYKTDFFLNNSNENDYFKTTFIFVK